MDCASGAAPAHLPTSQEELSHCPCASLVVSGGATANTVAERVEAETGSLAPDERLVMDSLVRLLAQLDLFSPDAFYHDGISQLLQRRRVRACRRRAHPQGGRGDRAEPLHPGNRPQVLAGEGVQVIIGAENDSAALKD